MQTDPRPSPMYCDDGNIDRGDGCDELCNIEQGFACTGGDQTQPDTCQEVCGDGIRKSEYTCDDGNL